jgi:glutamate-1-semialdehyde 2,1-aminomutase
MACHMQKKRISSFADLEHAPALKDLLFFDLVEAGVWLAKRGMIVMSLPLSDEDILKLESAVEKFILSHQSLLQ